MEIETVKGFIDPSLVIVVPMLWGIGMAVKKSEIENRFIPVILLICSCLVTMLHLTGTVPLTNRREYAGCLFAGITQGCVIWLCAWMSYEKILHNKEKDK